MNFHFVCEGSFAARLDRRWGVSGRSDHAHLAWMDRPSGIAGHGARQRSATAAGPPSLPGTLELWGGLECTMNRVGDVYFQQMVRNGHLERASDIDRFAELGIAA